MHVGRTDERGKKEKRGQEGGPCPPAPVLQGTARSGAEARKQRKQNEKMNEKKLDSCLQLGPLAHVAPLVLQVHLGTGGWMDGVGR